MNLKGQKKSNIVGDPFADMLGGSSQPQFGGQPKADPFASAFGNPGGFNQPQAQVNQNFGSANPFP